jgi:hypothetical protein
MRGLARDLKAALPKDAQREILFAILLLAAAWLAGKAGFNGRPRTVASSLFWPFYVDTWFIPAGRWSWRAVAPVLAMVAIWPLFRRWLSAPRATGWLLLGLLIAAWSYHLSVGIVRHGVVEGLTFTFHRPQEYWWDVHWVNGNFLRQFPDLHLSQHGGTHPPGVILFLYFIQRLGFTDMLHAELVCTLLGVLGALPLWGAARRLAPSERDEIARWAVVLYLFGCSIVAFSVLSMDMLVVLFGTIALYGFARALDNEIAGGVIAGLALAAASLCSFLALTLPLTWACILWSRRKPILPIAVSVVAFAAFYAGLALLGYRPFHVLFACMDALAHSDDRTRSRLLALVGNPIAFFGSLGIPFTGLAAHALWRALRDRRKLDDTGWLVLAALLPVAVNTLLGLPRAELERIYMPFIPALAVAAAAAARRWFARDVRWLTHVAAPLWVIQSILIESLYETYW